MFQKPKKLCLHLHFSPPNQGRSKALGLKASVILFTFCQRSAITIDSTHTSLILFVPLVPLRFGRKAKIDHCNTLLRNPQNCLKRILRGLDPP